MSRGEQIVLLDIISRKLLKSEKLKDKPIKNIRAVRKRIKIVSARPRRTAHQRGERRRILTFWRRRLRRWTKENLRNKAFNRRIMAQERRLRKRLTDRARKWNAIRSRVRWSILYAELRDDGTKSSPMRLYGAASAQGEVPLSVLLALTSPNRLGDISTIKELVCRHLAEVWESDGVYTVHTPGKYAYSLDRETFNPLNMVA